jgi:Zn-dependent protease
MSTDRPESEQPMPQPEVVEGELVPSAGDQPVYPPLDPLTSATLAVLEAPTKERTWLQSAMLLGVSLLVFAMTGFFNDPSRLVLVIGILLIHELGHYFGMRLFNYQDVRMFFIPLFGAAVAGRSRSVEGYKEAIVLLLGPLPGILLGIVLGIVAMFYDSDLLRSATMLLLFINGFNLLPFMPLDGGRLLHLILFSRNHYLEALFRVVTGALLALCGWALQGWVLMILGVSIVLGTGFVFRISKLARALRGPLQTGGEMDLAAKIPHELAVPLIEKVEQMFPQMKQPPALANIVRQVWERIHLRPPGVAASLGLLALYGFGFLAAPLSFLIFSIPIPSVTVHKDANGAAVRTQEVRIFGQLWKSTVLDDQNRPHGKHVTYDRASGRVLVEGTYVAGKRTGAWTTYDQNGQAKSVEHYQNGRLVRPPRDHPPNQPEQPLPNDPMANSRPVESQIGGLCS